MSMLRIIFLSLLVTLFTACSGDSSSTAEPADTTGAQDGGVNGTDSISTPDDSAVVGVSGCPTDHVTLNLTIDDSANKTYEDGELIWTGSFSYDSDSNTIDYATAWGITDGPYPYLYDDGPISEGGHEPEGAVAGDHIWGNSICYFAEQDRAIAYGLLNDDLRWIWVGPNGLLDVPAGTTGVIEAPGMVLPKHGDRDFEVRLDLNALSEDYATINLETHKVYIKGTMNSWTPVQLLDGGFLGDEVEGDGIVTYRQSFYLSKHTGLLQPGQEAQFVFVFASGDLDPDLALEYKTDGDAELSGVSARMLCLDGWADTEVIESLDSKGLSMNTAVTLCPEDPADSKLEGTSETECADDADCRGDMVCEEGACRTSTSDSCTDSSDCAPGLECYAGTCVPVEQPTPECDESTPCDETEVCVGGQCVPAPEGECNEQVPCTDPGAVCLDGACVIPDSQPELSLIIPALGGSAGNSQITLLGSGFVEGSSVTFGGLESEIQALTANEITVLTPAHPVGLVDVVVTSPDGGFSVYPDGFTYVEADQAPVVLSVSPASGSTEGGTEVIIEGANFEEGAVVRFGAATSDWTEVMGGGTSLRAPSPAQPVGTVDITVTNPDNQSATLADAFTYTPNQVDWGRLLTAAQVQILGGESIEVQAEIYEPGLTPGEGAGLGILAEVVWADAASDLLDDASWTATEASWLFDAVNDGGQLNNDVVGATITPSEGSWVVSVRVRLSEDQAWLWLGLDGPITEPSAQVLSTITVEAAPAVSVFTVTPTALFPLGGGFHSLEGTGLSTGCTATLEALSSCGEGQTATLALLEQDGLLGFISPTALELCGACGCVEGGAVLTLSCELGDATSTLTSPVWDGNVSKWPDASMLSSTTETSEWGPNVLSSLYAASDGTHLIIGVEGQVSDGGFGSNAIVAYIDVDPGAATGITASSELTDASGSVDSCLSGSLQLDIDGFGADIAFATLNMANSTDSDQAGWRRLDTTDDLSWLLDGALTTSNNGLEAVIPLETLFLSGPTGEERSISIVVRVTNAAGDAFSNQALPQSVGGTSNELTSEAASLSFTY